MTDFVPSFSDQSLIPPWRTLRSRHWAFVLEVPRHCMQDYLDSHLNAPGPDPSPYRYEALGKPTYGILMVTDHPQFSCAGGQREGWDTVAFRELFWQFPAYRYAVDGDNLASQEPDLVWIQPFYLVDNSTVMFASREIWGSEKQMADIGFETGDKTDELHLDVAIQGFTKFKPRSRSHSIGVLRINLDPGTEAVDYDAMIAHADAHGEARQLLDEWGSAIPGLGGDKDKPAHGVHIDTLKQFRDAFDMRVAAYRAIIASRATHENVQGLRYFRGSDVDLAFAWSDTMREQLKTLFDIDEPSAAEEDFAFTDADATPSELATDWHLPIIRKDVVLALAFQSDAKFEVLETLHTYGAGIFSP
ncbi:hypothetical protein K3148_10810 [Qipengyuania aurantiaca]|uniref:Uncharacterized protein n=1 Tax=Qipengyuania aurantiaca TaxID=2867233 RepID=A0ABX8ZK46_9SPHN|nr:hypothetical protein [Qipengyuania aurantiaca]QZD89304.1 hypothetical protein K3148_10810 [Qipengyuania aurantiaca]